MDNVVKEEAVVQNGESSQHPDPQPVAEPSVKQDSSPGCTPLTQSQQGSAAVPLNRLDQQDEEPHETHSFEWCYGVNTIAKTCNKATTVENLLMESSQFRDIAKKNQKEELVIVKGGKAISSHFPCRLIQNERLTIKYIKAGGMPVQPHSGPDHRKRKGPHGELVMFHLLTQGGKNVKRIMRNQELKKNLQEITVYAYKGEKVKQALRRDGRFSTSIFKKNCALSHTITEVTTEMSDLVDDLDGNTFKIILLNKSSPPPSQPGSLDDAYMTQNESQKFDSDGNQDPPQQSTTAESVYGNTPKQKPTLDGNEAPENMREMPNSKRMLRDLSSQFQDLVKGNKVQQGSKLSRIQNLFRVEYGKSAQTCTEVKTMKQLMDFSNSVCQVRINEKPEGSGFLLFDKFVLTNGHVVKNVYNVHTGQLYESVTIHFSYEIVDQMGSGAAVEEVVGFEYGPDASGHMNDWALLRLGADQKLPGVLLTRFGFLPKSGGICIIGHPHGGVKKIDPCLIVPTENRNQVVARHYQENPQGVVPDNPHYSENQEPIQLVTHRFFEDVKNDEPYRRALNYESCFYFGSSGSPVFDKHCNVIAMHSGGYVYKNARGVEQSVIEYGYPLSFIIADIVVQMVEKRSFDVLKEYLSCPYAHHQAMMTNLKKLVESRNLPAFKNAANNSEVTNDEALRAFFEFLFQREEPVPMDTE